MIRAVTEYLRECGRLLKWVFFQPSKLRAHIQQIAPDVADEVKSFAWLREARRNAELRRVLLQALLVTVVLSFLIDALIGLAVIAFGGDFNWTRSLSNLVFVIAFGIASGVTFSDGKEIAFDIAGGIVFGIAFSVVAGVAVGVVWDVPGGIAVGVAAGAACGIAVALVWGLDQVVVTGIPFSYILGFAGIGFARTGFAVGSIRGSVAFLFFVAIGIAGAAGGTRLIFYLFEIWPAIRAYRRSLNSDFPKEELSRSPVGFDEIMFWPQPFLSLLLLRVAEEDMEAGIRSISKVTCIPFQRWAAQKALRTLLEDKQRPFFFILDLLLTAPEPYVPTCFNSKERKRESDQHFSTKLLLAELMYYWPKARLDADDYWPSDSLPRAITFWLRKRGVSRYADLAEVYFRLLHQTPLILERVSGREGDKLADLGEGDFWDIPKVIKVLKDSRHLPDGKEFYQSLRLAEISLRCDSLQQVSKLRDKFAPLFDIEQPLRPQIVTVFRRLRDAAIDASAFLTGEHELTRKDALLKAGGVLEEARQLANEVYEPERSLLLAVIEHWRRMFAIEGGRVAEQREVEVLQNPYVAGRPIRPEDGQLFVGRKDEFRAIEEKLQTGVGVVIWGQRRIGKTSMLLHLPGHLSHDLLPVYLNLQMLMANTTGGFLYAVAREIVKQLSGRLSGTEPGAVATGSNSAGTQAESTGSLPLPVPYLPSAEEFSREPFLSFNHLLEDIERQLQPGQRVLLSFDEFEELEQRVKSGKIEPEIFAYLRGVTQTGRGFALLFAGLHTLEQMTREYWNPFFASVQTLKVGYLSELDAEQLITDPIEQFPLSYEYEAIKRITSLTRSHAYLTQSLCHNLVNRLNDPLYRSQKARREDVDAVVEKTLESSGYYFDDFVWGWSKAEERIALSLLAEVEGEASFSVIEKHLGREAALEATRKLVGRDILSERTGETGELVFRFQIPLAQMWVKQKKPSARILMEGGRL